MFFLVRIYIAYRKIVYFVSVRINVKILSDEMTPKNLK
jgi:hypothetical protein